MTKSLPSKVLDRPEQPKARQKLQVAASQSSRYEKQQSKRDRSHRVQFMCNAVLEGQLKRSKPNEKGRRQLFFMCGDGTLFSVFNIGREDTRALVWLFSHAEECFNQVQDWLVYPQATKGQTELVVASVLNRGNPETDVLRFSALLGTRWENDAEKLVLPLFIGRNKAPFEHNFMNLRIPKGFELSRLKPRCPVQGTARRIGHDFVLETLKTPELKIANN